MDVRLTLELCADINILVAEAVTFLGWPCDAAPPKEQNRPGMFVPLTAALAHEISTSHVFNSFFFCPAFAAGVPADVHFVPPERRPLRRCGRGGLAMTSMIHARTQPRPQMFSAWRASVVRFASHLAVLQGTPLPPSLPLDARNRRFWARLSYLAAQRAKRHSTGYAVECTMEFPACSCVDRSCVRSWT